MKVRYLKDNTGIIHHNKNPIHSWVEGEVEEIPETDITCLECLARRESFQRSEVPTL